MVPGETPVPVGDDLSFDDAELKAAEHLPVEEARLSDEPCEEMDAC